MILLWLALQVGTIPVAHYRWDSLFALPDTLQTPGQVLTTDTAIFCHPRTMAVRAVTRGMHQTVFALYGIPWSTHAAYEDDHVVSLELGGGNANANRFPQPLAQAKVKDQVENYFHRRVCAGAVSVPWVQYWLVRDWVVLLRYQEAHP